MMTHALPATPMASWLVMLPDLKIRYALDIHHHIICSSTGSPHGLVILGKVCSLLWSPQINCRLMMSMLHLTVSAGLSSTRVLAVNVTSITEMSERSAVSQTSVCTTG